MAEFVEILLIAKLLMAKLLIDTRPSSVSGLISFVRIPPSAMISPRVVIFPSLAIMTAPSKRLIVDRAERRSSEAREMIEFWSIRVVPTSREPETETL